MANLMLFVMGAFTELERAACLTPNANTSNICRTNLEIWLTTVLPVDIIRNTPPQIHNIIS